MKRTIAIVSLFFSFVLFAADDFKSIETFKARLPLYNKGRLQLFMYGERIKRTGTDIYIYGALLDIIKRNVSVDDIKYLDNLKFYSITTQVDEVAKFWKDKQHTDGIIKTKLAVVNQNSRMARGKENVYFRSPSLDINGVGFDAEYESRSINIHRDVTIRIRMDKLGEKTANKDRDRNILVKSHRMNLDFYSNTITVDGDVHVDVDGGKISIDCDKIIVFLSGDGESASDKKPEQNRKKTAAKKKKDDEDIRGDLGSFDGGGSRSVSKIVCLGNVKVRRKLAADVLQKSGRQEAEAGKATYFMKDGKIVLTGGRPVIHRGVDNVRGKKISLWRDTERMLVEGDCEFQVHVPRSENMGDLGGIGGGKKMKNAKRLLGTTHIFADYVNINYAANFAEFIGNVEIRDPQVSAESNRLKILLEEKPGTKNKKPSSLDIDNPSSQQKEVSKIIFTGDVRARNKKLTIFCEKMEMDVEDKLKTASQKMVKSVLGSGGRQLTRVICTENVRIIAHGNKNTKKKNKDEDEDTESSNSTSLAAISRKSGKGGTADCDYARLELLKNRAYLQGKVKVEQESVILNCEKMHVIARKKRALTEEEAEDEEFMQRITIGAERELEKIICLENVVIIRQLPAGGDDDDSQFGGGGKQKATGDKAVLDMDEHKITLDGKGKNQPTLHRGGAKFPGERIILWTDSEKLDIIKGRPKGIVLPKWD